MRSVRNQKISEEQRSLFKRKSVSNTNEAKKARPSSWTQKFMCLSQTDDDRVPTTLLARDTLQQSGLGEKSTHS